MRRRRAGTVGAVLLAAALAAGAHGAALDLSGRVKYFATLTALPEEDLQRRRSGTPAFGDELDLRLMLRRRDGGVTWMADHVTTLSRGDGLAAENLGVTLDQTARADDRRLLDLTWSVDDGDNHRLVHRFDRLAVRYRRGRWNANLGRQAVSWGNGLVFQPLDLFNPFAPTTVDQDYKTGDDLLLVERALVAGGSVQLLAVGRRREDGSRTASVAGKWHRFLGTSELELLAGRHYGDTVAGLGYRTPAGGALVRTDLLVTRRQGGGADVSGILNTDYSLIAGGRNVYVFAEYFHNAFGVRELPDAPAGYPQALVDRLSRGELFNLMRDYLALGGTVEWHPLWNQTATVIGNLHDGSVLLQTQLSHDPSDNQRLELGVLAPLGAAGDEFGGVPVAGEDLTVGGGLRAYLRWAYYFQ